jgi:hypothetical protein
MKKIGCLVLVMVLFLCFEIEAATINAASCSRSDVQSAIDSAGPGDTVVVPPGSATWTNSVSIDRGITLEGVGMDQTVITNAIGDTVSAIYFTPTSQAVANEESLRITGFAFDGNWTGSRGIQLSNSIPTQFNNVRIDHCKFEEMWGLTFDRSMWGVVDHNTFIDCIKCVRVQGHYWYSWDRYPANPGSSDGVVIEDNIMIYNAGGHTYNLLSSQSGGRWTFRYNTIDFSNISEYFDMFDAHGNQAQVNYGSCPDCATATASCCYNSRGVVTVELYGNTITVGSQGRFCRLRGSTARVFNNQITGTGSAGFQITEEDGCSRYSWLSSWPGWDSVKDAYVWNNTLNGNEIAASLQNYTCDEVFLQHNRDYWNYTASFNGSSGMGTGLLAGRPANCTVGVGYFATDVGDQGTLYRCTATNTWTAYYTPYTYPHPLVSGEPPPPPDTTPPGDIATVNDGSGGDIDSTYSTSQLQANWTAATDDESPITNYHYAIGTTPGGTQTLGWQTLGNVLTVTKTDLTLTIGETYYFSVKAQSAGGTGNATSSDGQFVEDSNDTTPPIDIVTVNDGAGQDIDTTSSTTELSANWSESSDPDTEILKYWYAIGDTPGSTGVVEWTSTGNGTVTGVTESGLSLTVGATYYFTVKAENGVSLQSNSTSSDGQCVLGGGTGPGGDETPPVISGVNAVNITMTGATITWDTDEPATSRVQYGATVSYGNSTVEDSNLVTGHSVDLTDLIPGIEYHYRVISKDSSSNEKISIDYKFTTPGEDKIDAKVYPSPYSPSKGNSMRFSVDRTTGGEVRIYTISGKLVKKLLIASGESDVNWDVLNEEGNSIKAGLYLYSITDSDGNKKTGKLAISSN